MVFYFIFVRFISEDSWLTCREKFCSSVFFNILHPSKPSWIILTMFFQFTLPVSHFPSFCLCIYLFSLSSFVHSLTSFYSTHLHDCSQSIFVFLFTISTSLPLLSNQTYFVQDLNFFISPSGFFTRKWISAAVKKSFFSESHFFITRLSLAQPTFTH